MTTPTLSDVREVERTILDADALNRLIEDAVTPPTCEVHDGDTIDDPLCGRPASWMTNASCGHSAYYCDGHKADAVLGIFVARATGAGLWCPLHGAARVEILSVEWVKL